MRKSSGEPDAAHDEILILMIGNNDNWNSLPPIVRNSIITAFTILAATVLFYFEQYAGIFEAMFGK